MTSIIAIVEGIDIGCLQKFISQFDLPWFQQAFKQQHFSTLDCGPIPYEPTNLTTIFSGFDASYHGCYSYWSAQNINATLPRVLTASDVLVPRLWHWPSMQSLTFGLVNIQLTHPPQPVPGYLFSYPMQQTLHATYPRSLQMQLSREGIRYAHDVSAFYRGQPAEEFVEKLSTIARYQLETALALAPKSDVLIVNLTLADRISHFFWPVLDSTNSSYCSSYLAQAYQFLDSALISLEKFVGENDFMLTLSEMGFGPLKEFVSIDSYLQEAGLQSSSSEGSLDFDKTLAYEAVQGSMGINLAIHESDLKKRDSHPHYKSLLNDVCQALVEFKFADGQHVIESAWPRSAIYNGPATYLAPDIIIKPGDATRPPLGDPRWAKHVNRSLQTGWHRDTGFYFLQGDLNSHERPTKLTDFAPLIARWLNKPIPDSLMHAVSYEQQYAGLS